MINKEIITIVLYSAVRHNKITCNIVCSMKKKFGNYHFAIATPKGRILVNNTSMGVSNNGRGFNISVSTP